MNNEINRRDFMKLSVASIMTASVTLNLGNGDVAYKSSYQTKPAITNAINAVDGKKLVSSGGQLFFTSYFAGSSNTDGKNSGRLRQNGSNYLASTKSYTYTEILHYYYDNSSYNNPSVGIVKIN